MYLNKRVSLQLFWSKRPNPHSHNFLCLNGSLFRIQKKGASNLCKEEDKISCSSNLVQNALQALGFSGEQSPERVGLQGNTLHLLGAEWPLGHHSLGLTLQSDYRLVDGVDPGAAGSVHYSQALLCRNTRHAFITAGKTFYKLKCNSFSTGEKNTCYNMILIMEAN